MERIVVVGASLAGINAAAALRREGFSGEVVVIDAQPHAPYDRPPLSKQLLRGERISAEIALGAADGLDVQWRLGETATALDVERRQLMVGDDEMRFDGLVLATGAAARSLPGTEAMRGVHTLRTLDDALALRAAIDAGVESVLVVGAGFIGAEVASSCRELGLAVALVEMADVPLERVLGAQIGSVLAEVHREHDVTVHLGTGIETIETTSGALQVTTSAGKTLSADVVVVGIGVVPDTAWLHDSGLTIDDGVVCDETLLAAPGVVAAGDVARWPSRRYGELLRVEHWEHAIASGEAAARRLLATDAPEVFDPVPWFWSDQYDHKMQLAGRSGADHDVEVAVGTLEERRFVAVYGRDGQATGVFGMNRPRHVTLLRRRLEQGCSFAELCEAAREL